MGGDSLSTRLFGKTGHKVTLVGLGGEGILRTHGRTEKAREVILKALEMGITYFDSARVYSDSELYYGSVWREMPEARRRVFQTSKSARRDREGVMLELQETLKRLHTDYLDLWQIHDIRTDRDFRKIEGPGGALEAFIEARGKGQVRAIGVTGHHDPRILTRAVREWPVDAVLMPVNPVEELLGGFLTSTLKEAKKKEIAVIGMKILGASNYIIPKWGISADLLIRYALSQEITVAIVGCSSNKEVQTLARTGREARAISGPESEKLKKVFEPYEREFAFYRGVL